jgi:hypothetical protein
MGNVTLFEIAAQYRADANKLAELDLDDQAVADTLESMAGALEEKAQAVVMFSKNLESTAAAIKEAEAAMAARRKAIERRAERLRDYVKTSMQVAGVSKIECPWFSLTLRQNPAGVDVFEPGLVPAEYMRHPEPPPPAPDKKAIADLLKAGMDVPGCRLMQTERLEIK